MNRHDRRATRGRACLAAYTAGGPPAHAPDQCDGTCILAVTVDPLARPEARARLLWLAREVMPELAGDQPSPGLSVIALLALAAVAACWLDGHAALARLLAWARSRAELARPGQALAVLPVPGPTRGALHSLYARRSETWPVLAALEAPVISP